MKARLSLLLVAVGATSCLSTDRPGLEVQVYPAGVIPGIVGRRVIDERSVIQGRIAANLTDRQDFGEHDDESGEGYGAGLGWRQALGASLDETGWLYGVRVDVWKLDIDWRDSGPGPQRGTTDVLVVQPTVEGGYGWTTAGGSRWELVLGVGAEINVDTDGEDVGEGAIGLLGLTWFW